MNRCRKCNTELIEQARFCNVCGSPQTPTGSQVEVSTPTRQETPVTTKTHRCQNCDIELPVEARFCNVCGSDQSSKALSLTAPTSGEPDTPEPTSADDKILSGSSQPSPSQVLTPTRAIQPGSKHASSSQQPGDSPIRPKTAKRPPVSPPRPTSIEVKSPAALPQSDPSQSSLSAKPAASATPINSSSPATAPETPELTTQSDTSMLANPPAISSSAEAENISKTPTQSLEDASVPARTPGLIRPIGPQSSARSVGPSRPGIAGTKNATHQYQDSTPQQVSGDIAHKHRQEQIARNPMAPLGDLDELPTNNLSTEHINGQNGLADTPTMNLLSPESFLVTSKAAEHWRKSWRDRQYAEAGPAENVSRGQASVPMPLMPMQQSFARMRAIAGTNKQQQNKHTLNLGSWITIFLMICLIAGLGAYIILSYLPGSPFGAVRVVPPANTTQPTLTLQGTTSQSVKIGQTIHLHGEQFSANDTITFLLDTTTSIVDAGGKNISAKANSQGTFDLTFLVGSDWTTGSHSIEAIDNASNLTAFLTIDVIPAGAPATTSKDLSVTIDGKPVQLLTFQTVIGQRNPDPQQITITNTSGQSLKWSAEATSNNHLSNNNLSWLIINDNQNFGELAISQPHKILISVNITGLKSTTGTIPPYTGQIVFTINDNQQLTLPVQLQILDAVPEMVFSPNPIIAHVAGNDCLSGVTLTLINLGTIVISWSVNPDDNFKDIIQFVDPVTGKLMEEGRLEPSGLTGDTQVLTLNCHGVQVGHQYHVSVYANQMHWSELVIIQQ